MAPIVLTRECFVFPLFLKTFPQLFAYFLFLRPQRESRTILLNLHFYVVGTGDLFFLRLPFSYSHIYFKDTGYKKFTILLLR